MPACRAECISPRAQMRARPRQLLRTQDLCNDCCPVNADVCTSSAAVHCAINRVNQADHRASPRAGETPPSGKGSAPLCCTITVRTSALMHTKALTNEHCTKLDVRYCTVHRSTRAVPMAKTQRSKEPSNQHPAQVHTPNTSHQRVPTAAARAELRPQLLLEL